MNALETMIRRAKRGLGLSSHSAFIRLLRPGYDSLLNILYRSRGLERSIPGEEPVRIMPCYRSISEETEAPVFAALKSRIRNGDVVLDIGANVGLISLVMASWVGKTGRIYAFEPAPESLRALRKHIRLNGMADRIEAVGCAVSDTAGEAAFYAHTYSGENTLSAFFARRVPDARGVRVPVTTIDDFCAARAIIPRLLKIDIEGFEFHALEGARQVLRRHRPTVIAELHPMVWKEIGLSTERVTQTLADLGYQARPLECQADPWAEYGHVVLDAVP